MPSYKNLDGTVPDRDARADRTTRSASMTRARAGAFEEERALAIVLREVGRALELRARLVEAPQLRE